MNKNNLKSFKDLTVWQKAVDLSVLVYKTTESFPQSEIYGIVNQMRRAVISVSSNIAEGFKRNHNKEKIQFYNIAHGSIAELESQIEVSYKLGFLSENDYLKLVDLSVEISKMINGLIKSSLNPQSSILNSTRGFTVIELIVSMSLFVIISGIIVGSFITATRTQRAIISLIEARDNMGIAMEQMARDVRLGTNFDVNLSNTIGGGISFYNLNGDQISYIFDENNGVLLRQKNSEAPLPITSNDLTIKNFRASYADYFGVPRITVSFSVIPKDASLKDNFSFNIQTTISGRQF